MMSSRILGADAKRSRKFKVHDNRISIKLRLECICLERIWDSAAFFFPFPTVLRLVAVRSTFILLLTYIYTLKHGLRTPREDIAFTARPKTQSQSQIFRYDGSIFCLPHRPNFSDIFDLCLH